MCGIAGIVAWDEKYRVQRDQLQRMADSLAHRGPDGEGFYLNHDREITPENPQCGFAFRRLAIIDPDPRSNQPFTIGHLTLVFNGEIYNYRELRAEISTLRPNYQWRTQGDGEVLLMSYEVWREKCVEHLNGMFAFAVWDDREKSLFLARDRMGQKPLYFAAPKGYVAFASELSAFKAIRFLSFDTSTAALIEFLRWGYYLAPATIYTHIKQVWPSQWIRFPSQSGLSYFGRNKTDENIPCSVETLKASLGRAVTRQLVSDVPLGCFLSGGIDSSIIALAAAKSSQLTGQLKTFSIKFGDRRYDESPFAQAVADALKTDHKTFTIQPTIAEDLPQLARIFGEPFADSSAIPTHYLSREVRNHVKVALSGDGGDELFGGYDRYRAMKISQRFDRIPKLARDLVADQIGSHIRSGDQKSMKSRLGRLLRSVNLSPAERYGAYLRVFFDDTIVDLLSLPSGHVLGEGPMPHVIKKHLLLRSGDAVMGALAFDRVSYLPGDLLTKVDRASMLHGLEVRSPFMDHELVQFAAGLTTDQLLKGGPKRMLREAFAKDLPDFVFKRPKMGFAVPIGEWFRGELRAMLRDNLFAADSFARQHFSMKVVERLVDEHEQFRADHSQRLYALLMLELWWRWHRSL